MRAVLTLAEDHGADEWTTAFDIAERAVIPLKYLEAILVELRAAGMVESRRGAAGGHRLALAPGELTVAEVVRLMDGPIALTPCASRLNFEACKDCVSVHTCRIRRIMQRARDAAAAVLEGCSISDMMQVPDLQERVLPHSRLRRSKNHS